MTTMTSSNVNVVGPRTRESSRVLTSDALAFVGRLHSEFGDRRRELLQRRKERWESLQSGASRLDFATSGPALGDWRVAAAPSDLDDRRVEITGPAERKMMINALNSGASVFMADLEDALSPTWDNVVDGQGALMDAVRRTLSFTSPEGKKYTLNEKLATLVVRPRGWHLVEEHVYVDGHPVSASLFDFALYFFHNAKELIARGTGPYFYLPKMESHLEARLWNDVFVRAQEELGIPVGTIRATVLIETILAAFEMHEILFELREHSSGLNCGRWDYIFSFIKKFRARRDFVMPDRASVTMDKAFLAAYVDLLIQTCHRRGIHAMGGMAAQIPIKDDAAANEAAFAKVEADKLREVRAGHDGTWVAHPALVAVAKRVFDEYMPGANNLGVLRQSRSSESGSDAAALLEIPDGVVTEKGIRHNVSVGIQYLAAWLGGSGAVPLYNLMEDAATAEISRTQLWQWVQHGAKTDSGELVTPSLYRRIREEELRAIGTHPNIDRAARIFDELILNPELADFLTIPAYAELLRLETT